MARARQRETDKVHGTGEKGAEDHESTAALRPRPCLVLSCCCVLPIMTSTNFLPGCPANDTSLVSNNNVAQLNEVDTTLIDVTQQSEEKVAVVCGTKRTRDTRGWDTRDPISKRQTQAVEVDNGDRPAAEPGRRTRLQDTEDVVGVDSAPEDGR